MAFFPHRLALCALIPGLLSADPVGVNPGFEDDLNGWTHTDVAVETGGAFEGTKRLQLQNGFIEQTVTGLVAGETHSVRLAYVSQAGVDGLADASVKIDGVEIGRIHTGQTNEFLSANGFEFIPASASAVLRVDSLETGSTALILDAVRVEAGGMPLPPEADWSSLTVVADARGGRALVNGGFESPIGDPATDPDNSGPVGNEHLSGFSLPGWRVTRENVDVIQFGGANPPEGANALDTGGHGPGGIAQTITGLTPGATYTFSFLHARHLYWGTDPMTADVLVNGQHTATLVRTIDQAWDAGYGLVEVPALAGDDGKLTLEVRSTITDQGGNIIFDDFRIAEGGDIGNPPTGPIKLLVLEGASNHDWQRRIAVFQSILSRDGSFEMDVSVVPQDVNSPEWAAWSPDFSSYDVVLSGYSDVAGGAPWPTAVQEAFAAYVQNGGGFYAFHETNQAFTNWQAWQEIVGLTWHDAGTGTAFTVNPDDSLTVHPPGSGLATGHGARADSLVKRHGLPTVHPIHAGLPDSWMAADLEVVRFPRGIAADLATKVTILSYTVDPDPPPGETALQHPVEWTVSYGDGRVYATTYGHVFSDQSEPEGMRCAAYQETFVRALKWCAGRNPGTQVPVDFPSDTTISLRPYSEGFAGFGGAKAVDPFADGVLPTRSIVPTEVDTVEAFPNLSWESPIVALPWPGSTSELMIAEMDGRVFRVADDDATTTAATVLDIRDRCWYMEWDPGVPSHRHGGILGAAFHPQFGQGAGKDHLYVYYLNHPDDNDSAVVDATHPYYERLSCFTWDPETSMFDPASELIMIQQFDTARGHDGGGLVFGGDGFLYLTVGDEGTESSDATPHTQRIDDRFRSGVWRIDVDMIGGSVSHPIVNQPAEPPLQPGETNVDDIDHTFTQGYYIPSDNPWVGETGALEEFYAIGLREPHRMTYDPVDGNFWIADVGGAALEEVNVMDKAGLNFQWNYKEGTSTGFRPVPSPLLGEEREPIYEYDHGVGNCIIGGHVYRGSDIPEIHGKYIFGDNGSQLYYALEFDSETNAPISVTQIGQGRAGVLWDGISSFGLDSRGEMLLLQMGAGAGGNGRISRIKRSGTISGETWEYPPLLSQTGVFDDLATLTPAQGMVPYEVNMPLWSSGVSKKRWVMIPNDGVPNTPQERIEYSENHAWQFPVGTVFVKHFERPDNGEPLETRLLVHGNDGWGGVTYKWRTGEAEADLAEDGLTESLTIDGRTFDYLYPSRNQCVQCHQAGTGPVLGFRTRQLNREITYPNGHTANQIESFSAAGFIPEVLKAADLTDVITSADVDDPFVSDEEYVRSYLDSNCSHCHQPAGSSRAFFDARLTTPLNNQSLICGPLIDGLGLTSPAVIKPGSLDNSVLFQRTSAHDSAIVMPPLARGPVDVVSVARLASWILSMDADSCTKSQSFFGGGELGNGAAPGGPTGSDPWVSNIVIQKSSTFTNNEAHPVTLLLDRFTFHAAAGGSLTPFLVRVNAPDDFTVVAIGDTRAVAQTGEISVPFRDSPVSIQIAPGETIAHGFIDALPDGSGGSGGEIVSWTDGGLPVWHGGGPLASDAGSVFLGQAPSPGTNLVSNQTRDYHFAVSFIISGMELGNPLDQPGYQIVDGANSNFVINLEDSFTNLTSDTLTVSVDRFRFHASRVTDPLTPFVVRVNGPGDVTVLAIGDARSIYQLGVNDVPFSAAQTTIAIAPGETVAPGFIDNLPDGTPGTQNGAITFIYGPDTPDGGDVIYYIYDVLDMGVVLELGQAPQVPFRYTPGDGFQRDYLFSVTLGFGGKEDEDEDGLKDSWELAFATDLDVLSANADSDGDGMRDSAELAAGTNPLDRTDLMRTLDLSPGASGATARIQTVPGRSYRARVSVDLETWLDAGVFKAADWPAEETPVLLPHATLPAGAEERLFLKVAPVR
ncbi:MAG: PQQ-dependent sugar dehydrogenase [Akkermansiaceae bacterium]|nr:PQQ-dependent sugar dehydrogenase [Akkermansiaceae bacterium]